MTGSAQITDWDPEDTAAWEDHGKSIADRNLFWSIATNHVAFGVWTLWSVLVLFMPEQVYGFDSSDKFTLVATNTLVGALARIPYTVGVGVFGGRDFTVATTLVLLLPTAGTIMLLSDPGLPLWPYLVCAALTGLGGGNFSASMTNINAFYPQRLKGAALGINAAGANIGASVIQLVGLVVIAVAGHRQPYWVSGLYMVLVTATSIGALLFMNNVEGYRIDLASMRSMLREHHTWLISLLYTGSFGSFIGLSFGLSQVLQQKFTDAGQSHGQAALHAAQVAFVGPLLGSVARVYGGRISDRAGGDRVTLICFGAMVGAAALLVGASTIDDHHGGLLTGPSIVGYVVGLVGLFVMAGGANGSIYKMIPSVFEDRSHLLGVD
jgi:NNP family nitrate/nitrite transporter-like MFS transporter